MAVVRCWDCGFEKVVPNVEEARRLARLHMGMIGHIMVFGYKDEELK